MMNAFLDGNPVQFPTKSLQYPKFTFRRNDETGEKSLSFTGDLEFMGADKDYIFQKLVTDPNARANSIVLKLVDDCCGNHEYKFLIKADSIEWCEADPNCSLTATAVEYSVDSQYYACFKNTLVYDNHNGFQSQAHPRMTYCLEFRPSALQDAVILLGLLGDAVLISLVPLIIAFLLVVAVINGIIAFINVLGAGLNPIGGGVGNIASNLLNFWQTYNEFFIGCGRKHPSPFVRSYVNNVCAKCGTTFQSSIFNDSNSDYYNTVYFNAPVSKGVDRTDNTTYWVDKNRPILSGSMFLDQVKLPHNAEWRIVNGVVILERRDFFQSSAPWLDLTSHPNIEKLCWSWSKKDRPAYGDFQYGKDAVDWVGNEALDRWNEVVEWNSPPNPTQKGSKEVTLPFAAGRFRIDGIERDVLDSYNNWPIVGNVIQGFDHVLLLNNGTAFTPKLLIYDPSTPLSDARTMVYYPPGNTNAGLNQHFNYPYWFDKTTPGNIYDRYWEIENPRSSTMLGLYDFEATIMFTCADKNAIDVDGTVMTSFGLGIVTSVDVDEATGRMIIKGTV